VLERDGVGEGVYVSPIRHFDEKTPACGQTLRKGAEPSCGLDNVLENVTEHDEVVLQVGMGLGRPVERLASDERARKCT
jgi:hypothetical protein